jgi:hypothetical protein
VIYTPIESDGDPLRAKYYTLPRNTEHDARPILEFVLKHRDRWLAADETSSKTRPYEAL